MRRQLCDDAMAMLVLWATKQEYDAVRAGGGGGDCLGGSAAAA
jgi:hypothetical protein